MVKKEVLGKLRRFRALLNKSGVPVSKVVLYGSHARGTARKESDIDVCIVSKNFGRNRMKEMFSLLHLAPRVDARIEPVPCSLQDFRNNRVSPLLHQIRKEGIEVR